MNGSDAAAVERAAREGALLFARPELGRIRVGGADRVRWLDGMLSCDMKKLAAGPVGAGCPGLMLTRTGRIQADFQVLMRSDSCWLELEAEALPATLQALAAFVVADDVELEDASRLHERFSLEGPRAADWLDAVAGFSIAPPVGGWIDGEIAGLRCAIGAWGFSAARSRQLFAPAGSGSALRAALLARAAEFSAREGSAADREVLRIEAGAPRLGRELGEEVLPPEAGLDHAVSRDKGCYRGQEVIARLASRGGIKHRLVGLRCASLPAPGAPILFGDRRIGEVTSAALSPGFGPIALAFVRIEQAAPDTAVWVEGVEARVSALPFSGPRSILPGSARSPSGEPRCPAERFQ